MNASEKIVRHEVERDTRMLPEVMPVHTMASTGQEIRFMLFVRRKFLVTKQRTNEVSSTMST